MKPVAIVIPTYNNLPELRLCLKALSQQTYKDFVAYVCVDGSTDGTLDYLAHQPYAFVQVLTHPDRRNRGRNATRNLILSHLDRHDWVAFLDSDSVPLPDWLERFLAAQPTDEEVLLGKILYYASDGPNIWHLYRQWRERVQSKRPVDFRHFISINALLSAAKLKEVGGFDERIRRHGLDDIELGWRLEAIGLRFRRVVEAKVWSASQHKPLASLLRFYEMARYNLPYFHEKHPASRLRLYKGTWLIKPFYRWISRLLFFFVRPRLIYELLPYVPQGLKVRFFHYLAFYAIAQGYQKKPWPLHKA